MKEQFLAQEAIMAGKKSRKLLMGAFLFFTCMVSILAFALKDSMDLSDVKSKKILLAFGALAAVMILSVIVGMIKSFRVPRKGQNLKLPMKENSKEAVAAIINKEVEEGKLLLNEYMSCFPEGKKPYGSRVLLTESYLMLTEDTGIFTAIPRDKIYWFCAQPGIKGRSSYIVRFLVFTENGTFSVDGVDGEYVEKVAEKFYQYIPNVFKDYDVFELSYQLEAMYAKNRPAFLAFYEEEKVKMANSTVKKENPGTLDISLTLENQNGKISNIRDIDIEDYLEDMFADNDQFVILAPEKTVNGIAFVQACQVKDQISVQLGLEEKNGSRLVEIYCSKQECMDIFLHFYDTGRVENMERYTPVQRM